MIHVAHKLLICLIIKSESAVIVVSVRVFLLDLGGHFLLSEARSSKFNDQTTRQ